MRASVTSILYGPAEDGYVMVSLRTDHEDRIVAAGRQMPADIQVGDEISATGRWTDTKRGRVFNVQTATKALPVTTEGIKRWLGKAKVPGIGAIKADRLVARFGMGTIDAIASEEEDAAVIVGRKRIAAAASAIRARRQEAEIGSTLSEHGIGTRTQRKIVEKYGDRTHHVLTAEPYRLIIDIEGVAFSTADKIARAAGLAKDAPSRIQAAIVDQLRQGVGNGHCAMYHQQLVERCRQAIYVGETQIEAELDALSGKQIVETTVRDTRAWALKSVNQHENEFARHLVRKLRDGSIDNFGLPAIEKAVDEAQQALGISLSDEQRAGAVMALNSRLSILTGGPGTGKTHTLRIICEAWRHLSRSIRMRSEESNQIALAAPTGKASKRITETTGIEGRTIHRLLEFRPDIGDFERNLDNPLLVGMIGADEASMLDIFISTKFARAWGRARVLLIGDVNQLPSVGPGKVLADMLGSGVVPHTRLTRIYRQAAGSDISLGAERIVDGDMPVLAAPGKGDLVHIEIEDSADTAARVVSMYAERLPRYAEQNGIDPASIQILCPGHQTEVGTIALNAAIQRRLRGEFPNGQQVMISDKASAGPGDKVIQLENDYERMIFNGDTGVVVEVEKDASGVTTTHVDFGGRMQSFQGVVLNNLALAYALSIHKSQGSEYQIVIIPVTTSHSNMLRRTLLYTGVTRAKRLCILVGSRRAIRIAVSREDSTTRITTLMDAIVREWRKAVEE